MPGKKKKAGKSFKGGEKRKKEKGWHLHCCLPALSSSVLHVYHHWQQ
jgi:hypothetical protein